MSLDAFGVEEEEVKVKFLPEKRMMKNLFKTSSMQGMFYSMFLVCK